VAMQVKTKFLRLFKPASLGDEIDGWRVCLDRRVGQMPGALRRDGQAAAKNGSRATASKEPRRCNRIAPIISACPREQSLTANMYTEGTMAIDVETLQAALIGYQSEQERIERAIADLHAQLKGAKPASSSAGALPTKPRRKMSAAARKRIAAAQRKRWAEYHKSHKG
jgi:hypothetical protein